MQSSDHGSVVVDAAVDVGGIEVTEHLERAPQAGAKPPQMGTELAALIRTGGIRYLNALIKQGLATLYRKSRIRSEGDLSNKELMF